MAQVNRNLDYLITTDGLTVWEKLRNTRNFLDDRIRALKKLEARKKFFNKDNLTDLELADYEIDKEFNEGLEEDCRNEIQFLEKLEKALSEEAEKTRVPGASDKEMYEINFTEEKIQRELLTIKAEVLATGRISPQTAEKLIKNPVTISRAIDLKLLPENFAAINNLTSIPVLDFIRKEEKELLKIEYKE